MPDPQPLRDDLTAESLLLTAEEAARVPRVGRTTIYALMKAGVLRPVHIGRSCRLLRAELERYVRRQAPRPVPPRPPARQRPTTDQRGPARTSADQRGPARTSADQRGLFDLGPAPDDAA